MPCYHPLHAVYSQTTNPTGKRSLIFPKRKPFSFEEKVDIPCGKCRGCRHEHARQWAVRICHEANLYNGNNCFITLTFDDKKRAYSPTLKKEDFQLFMKRLRKEYYGNEKSDVRYYHCGEYGEQFSRPHHHAILFNHTFEDQIFWQTKRGHNYYRSPTLEKLWPYGNSVIGAVTFADAAYVARYCIKKINGEMAPGHYQGRLPEFATMSRRPGIAFEWYEKYKDTDVFPRDYIVLNGVKGKVPKYYNKRYELTNPEEYGTIKNVRIQKAKENPNNHPDRLKAAEQIQFCRDNQLKRSYETQTNGD